MTDDLFKMLANFVKLSKAQQLTALKALENDERLLNALINIGWTAGDAEVIEVFDEEVQREILELALKNERFAGVLDLPGLYARLPDQLQDKVLEVARTGVETYAKFAFGCGTRTLQIPEERRSRLLALAETDRQFQLMFCHGLASSLLDSELEKTQASEFLSRLKEELQAQLGLALVNLLAVRESKQQTTPLNGDFLDVVEAVRGRLALEFVRQIAERPETLLPIVPFLKRESWLARQLGLAIGEKLPTFKKREAERLAGLVKAGGDFALGLIEGAGQHPQALVALLSEDDVREAIASDANVARAMGLAVGKAFASIKGDKRRFLERMAESNGDFALGLGAGIASAIPSLDEKTMDEVEQLKSRSAEFRRGVELASSRDADLSSRAVYTRSLI